MLEKMISMLVGRPVTKAEAERIYNEKLDFIKKAVKEDSNENQK